MISRKESFLLILHSLMLILEDCSAASSPGAASSVFSSRGGSSKNQNRNDPFNPSGGGNAYLDDWYDVSSNSSTNYQANRNRNMYGILDNPSATNIPDEQYLIAKLLKNYDPASRPVFNASKPVVVKFGFALIQICDMVTLLLLLFSLLNK